MKLTDSQLKKIINEELSICLENLSPDEIQHLIDEGWLDKAKKGLATGLTAAALASGGMPGEASAAPVGGGQGVEQVSQSDQKEVLAVLRGTIKAMRRQGKSMGTDPHQIKMRMRRGEINNVEQLLNNTWAKGRPWFSTMEKVAETR